MTTYQLTITLDQAAVQTISQAGQAVTLAQNVTSFVESGESLDAVASKPAVAWLAFSPFENNTVAWTDELSLYASTGELTVGSVLTINSQTGAAVQLGESYPFQNGVFGAAATGVSGSYTVANQEQGTSYLFGLLAAATVNGNSTSGPLDAAAVLYNEDGYFSPPTAVYVFLSTASANGTVLLDVPDSALEIAITQGLVADVCFNDSTNQFYRCS
jgi:hypothetical protein